MGYICIVDSRCSISTFSPILGALIGLGVGVDYALFIVTRYRSGLLGGLSPEQATNPIPLSGPAEAHTDIVHYVALILLGTMLDLDCDELNSPDCCDRRS